MMKTDGPMPDRDLKDQREPSLVLLDWGDTVMKVLPYPGPMDLWPEVEAMPGIGKALRTLRDRHILALATNAADSDEEAIRRALRRADLGHLFQHVFCVANLGTMKPSRAFFTRILDKVGTSPARTIMVGDSYQADVHGALSAGLAAIWLSSDTRARKEGPRLRTIHHLTELPRAVQTLLGE